MYKHNLTPAYLTDEQKKEMFSLENLMKNWGNPEEKKETEEMTEMDILIDTLIQKQNNILNKAQIVDEKAEIYKLSEKGDVIEQLITAYTVMEEELDSSIESFEKAEEAVTNAWTKIKNQTLEAWESISQQYEEAEEIERQAMLDEKLDQLELKNRLGLKKEEPQEEIVYVELGISIPAPENGRISNYYVIEYSIEERKGITRNGKMRFDPFKYNKGSVTDLAADLISRYKKELKNGDKIKYKGFI